MPVSNTPVTSNFSMCGTGAPVTGSSVPFPLLLPAAHHHVFADGQHANVGAADQDFFTEIVLQSVHHTDDHDQSAHPDDDAADRDDADQREQPRATPAAQVSPGNRKLE